LHQTGRESHSRLDCVTIFASPLGCPAFPLFLAQYLQKAITNFKRDSLYTIFNKTAQMMSRDVAYNRGLKYFQLPEMVSSLTKDVYFFKPESEFEVQKKKLDKCFKNVLEMNLRPCQDKLQKMKAIISKMSENEDERASLTQGILMIEQDFEYGLNCLEKQLCDKETDQRFESKPSPSFYSEYDDWKEFKFITMKKGAYGPSKAECLRYYQEINWIENTSLFNVSRDGFQTLRIPTTAIYEIEIVAPGNCLEKRPGVRIKGTFALETGDKITTALGQQGSHKWGCCGSGGSFITLDTRDGPKPLLISGGAGSARFDENFERGNKDQNLIAKERRGSNKSGSGRRGAIRRVSDPKNVQIRAPGSSGQQQYIAGDENLDEAIYCAGAGFKEAPNIQGNLVRDCIAPKTYSDGLTGGLGRNSKGQVQQGGFGGGGSYYRRPGNRSLYYHGAGGGFTGGSTMVYKEHHCYGGGGGSYSADPNATLDHHYVEFGECTIRKL